MALAPDQRRLPLETISANSPVCYGRAFYTARYPWATDTVGLPQLYEAAAGQALNVEQPKEVRQVAADAKVRLLGSYGPVKNMTAFPDKNGKIGQAVARRSAGWS